MNKNKTRNLLRNSGMSNSTVYMCEVHCSHMREVQISCVHLMHVRLFSSVLKILQLCTVEILPINTDVRNQFFTSMQYTILSDIFA